jgi:hypothetical protein
MVHSRLFASLTVAAAVTAGGVAGAVLAVPSLSGAQTTTTTPSNGSDDANGGAPDRHKGPPLLDAAAAALNLTPEELREKLSDGETTIADVAQEQNVDIDTVIDAMTNADRERIEALVDEPWRGHGPGPGGFGFGGRHRGPGGLHFFAGHDALADALDISEDDLHEKLRDGKTIAEIAQESGKSVDSIVDALVQSANEHIDEAVADGHLTEERANDLKADLQERITRFVNGEAPFGMKFRGPFGPGRPGDTD